MLEREASQQKDAVSLCVVLMANRGSRSVENVTKEHGCLAEAGSTFIPSTGWSAHGITAHESLSVPLWSTTLNSLPHGTFQGRREMREAV